MSKNKLAINFLRVGMAFVFLYASIEIYLNPSNILKYIPKFVLDIVPHQPFLDAFGVAEILLAIWLVSGWKGIYPAALSVAILIAICAFNPEYFQILFRNVAIAFGGLALIVLEITNHHSRTTLTASPAKS